MECITVGQRVSKSILVEASSIKAGNVHPGASFSDMRFEDFQVASEAIGGAFERSVHTNSLGELVLAGVQAMVESVRINTSLGTILLLAPMVLCPRSSFPSLAVKRWDTIPFQQAVSGVISDSTLEDSRKIYRAIGLANPGGLGQVETNDVRMGAATLIFDAMYQASRWDDVALQYSNGFEQVVHWAERLVKLAEHYSITDAIRCLQIEILAARPDSLIVRKHGQAIGLRVQQMSQEVLRSGDYGGQEFEQKWMVLDHFLRGGESRKNPGTTADLIAAAIFLASYRWDRWDG